MKYNGSVNNTVIVSRYSFATIIGLFLLMYGMVAAMAMGY